MKLISPENAIGCHLKSGPIFGGPSQAEGLKIADKCDTNQESTVKFPSSYSEQQIFSYLLGFYCCGNVDGKFKVLEYEVFLVNW